jgi:hypothetical protein
MKKNSTFILAFALLAVGCSGPLPTVTVPTASQVTGADATEPPVTAEAGLPILGREAAPAATPGGAPATPVVDIFTVARGMNFASRRDPFALMRGEISFDREQTAARLLNETGTWRTDYEPQPDVEPDSFKEPVLVPNWRVSGVVISDSVLALIDTGARVYDVRPGQTVPETEWVVVAIDEESVLLRHRRDVEPKEVRINLQSQIFGIPGADGGQGGGGQFGPGGPGGPGGNRGGQDPEGDR